MASDPVFVREVEEFLFHEAALLDGRRFEEWFALFAEDGIYWIPATPGQEDPIGEVSIAYEDRQLLDVRVRRLRHPANYSDQPPTRARRVIGNVRIEDGGGAGAGAGAGGDSGEITVRSNFVMADFRDDAQRLFAGDYLHRLRRAGDGFRIALKRVNLLNCDAPMGPFVIPF